MPNHLFGPNGKTPNKMRISGTRNKNSAVTAVTPWDLHVAAELRNPVKILQHGMCRHHECYSKGSAHTPGSCMEYQLLHDPKMRQMHKGIAQEQLRVSQSLAKFPLADFCSVNQGPPCALS